MKIEVYLASYITGSVVALGKFDALHIGHRALAVQASKMGAPVLLSFARMAEVLQWEKRCVASSFFSSSIACLLFM